MPVVQADNETIEGWSYASLFAPGSDPSGTVYTRSEPCGTSIQSLISCMGCYITTDTHVYQGFLATHAHIHSHMSAYMHTYMHICIHTYIHMYIVWCANVDRHIHSSVHFVSFVLCTNQIWTSAYNASFTQYPRCGVAPTTPGGPPHLAGIRRCAFVAKTEFSYMGYVETFSFYSSEQLFTLMDG